MDKGSNISGAYLAPNQISQLRADLLAGSRTKKTVALYMGDLAAYAAWYFAEYGELFSIELLTAVDLRAYREHSLELERLAPATWNRRRASLAVVSSWGQDNGYLAYDPMSGVEGAKEVDSGPRWITGAQLRKIQRILEIDINGATTDSWRIQAIRDNAIINLMARAGLREAEVTALDVSDITLGARSGSVQIRRGKGDKTRSVPLGKEARQALALWLDTRDEGYIALFPGKGSGRITTRTIQRRVKDISGRAGVPITAHQLRHTCAKELLNKGAALPVVQKVLGHARIETTARYLKPGWGDLVAAMEGI